MCGPASLFLNHGRNPRGCSLTSSPGSRHRTSLDAGVRAPGEEQWHGAALAGDDQACVFRPLWISAHLKIGASCICALEKASTGISAAGRTLATGIFRQTHLYAA